MALSHLILNKLKWWSIDSNAESQIINGKQYFTFPSKVRTNDLVDVGVISGNCSVRRNEMLNVIGASEKYYVAHGEVTYAGGSHGTEDFLIKKSDCTPIWGGKTSPSHFWQWIKSLLYPTREGA